jgi:hypothetical protein
LSGKILQNSFSVRIAVAYHSNVVYMGDLRCLISSMECRFLSNIMEIYITYEVLFGSIEVVEVVRKNIAELFLNEVLNHDRLYVVEMRVLLAKDADCLANIIWRSILLTRYCLVQLK